MISKLHILIDLGLRSQISSSNFWEKTSFIQAMIFHSKWKYFLLSITILWETWVFIVMKNDDFLLRKWKIMQWERENKSLKTSTNFCPTLPVQIQTLLQSKK